MLDLSQSTCLRIANMINYKLFMHVCHTNNFTFFMNRRIQHSANRRSNTKKNYFACLKFYKLYPLGRKLLIHLVYKYGFLSASGLYKRWKLS